MNAKTKAKLEAAGFRFGDAADFLGLSDEEQKVIDLQLRIAKMIRELRLARGMTQQDLATKIGSSQPRVAKLESGAAGVTLDLRFRTLFALGGSVAELFAKRKRTGKTTASPTPRPRRAGGR